MIDSQFVLFLFYLISFLLVVLLGIKLVDFWKLKRELKQYEDRFAEAFKLRMYGQHLTRIVQRDVPSGITPVVEIASLELDDPTFRNKLAYKILLEDSLTRPVTEKSELEIFLKLRQISWENEFPKAFNHIPELSGVKNEELNKVQKILEHHLLDTYNSIYKPFLLPLNAGLIMSVFQRVIDAVKKGGIDEATIVGIMVGKRIKANTKAYMFLILSLIAHVALNFFLANSVNGYLILFLITMISLLGVNQKITEYRIRKNYFGSNEYEAREIVQFILDNVDKTDFTSGGNVKRLLPFPDINSTKTSSQSVEGVIYA